LIFIKQSSNEEGRMKAKILRAVLIAVFLGTAATANATMIDLTHQWSSTVHGITLPVQFFANDETATWSYDLSAADSGFTVPFDVVTSASLQIVAYLVNSGGNDEVKFSTDLLGYLNDGSGFFNASNTYFDLTSSVFGTWTSADNPLTFTLTVRDFAGLKLDYARLKLCYNDGTQPPAQVPEPGTILLMGTGVLGMVLVRRMRNRS
jgi:hypothetical protein